MVPSLKDKLNAKVLSIFITIFIECVKAGLTKSQTKEVLKKDDILKDILEYPDHEDTAYYELIRQTQKITRIRLERPQRPQRSKKQPKLIVNEQEAKKLMLLQMYLTT